MTTDRHLALMALMRQIEKPAAIYQRAVRKATRTLTGSPENEAAQACGNDALLVIEQEVRAWVAAHPAEKQPAAEEPRRVQCNDCGAVGEVFTGDDGLAYLDPSGQIGHRPAAVGSVVAADTATGP